ncbi:P-loop NTPase fold protein [Gimesia fumaroli]|uniref:KAP family P-loop domain protein n=1 Tax=Gimesia fumaroli TaxID=2527976 RepID=A0A518IBI2_9PLAN|nr:P-loop NTPase fold protein [Gimesia fumaroli]QDV50468.1 KAP family P-loop domain protein [Gimesia fumaroli]
MANSDDDNIRLDVNDDSEFELEIPLNEVTDDSDINLISIDDDDSETINVYDSDDSEFELDLGEDEDEIDLEQPTSTFEPESTEPRTDLEIEIDPDAVTLGGRTILRRDATDNELSLNADDYAQVIADVLEGADDTERMTFALFGHWGRGKTYLTHRLISSLQNATVKYETVLFSAWKYRTTPEIWAYMFQQFLEQGKKTSSGLVLRAAFKKHGPLPLLGALFGLFISLFSVSDWLNISSWLVQFLGVGAVCYAVLLLVRFQNTFIRLKSLYTFSGHSEKLGLQAAIGDDLSALLKAWIPDKISLWHKVKNNFLTLIFGTTICGLILWKIYSAIHSLGVNPYVTLAGYLFWVFLLLSFLFVASAWSRNTTDRILLVVDDLDRCEPSQMLEIIESTMLILDDPEIHSRLQVLMLIDESAFLQALIKKYKYLTHNLELGQHHTYNTRRIVRENLEKFFLVHLRLPPLSNEEIVEVTEKYITQLCEGELGHNHTRKSSSPNKSKTMPSANTTDSSTLSKKILETDRPIETEEMKALLSAMNSITNSQDRDTIGPRSIRCLLFRYQLARRILIKLNQMPDASDLAQAVMDSFLQEQDRDSKEVSIVERVVEQVS